MARRTVKQRMPHEKIVEMFKGKHNIITVLLVVVGSIFVAKTLWEIFIRQFGEGWTIFWGIMLMIIGYYISDELHKRYGTINSF